MAATKGKGITTSWCSYLSYCFCARAHKESPYEQADTEYMNLDRVMWMCEDHPTSEGNYCKLGSEMALAHS